MTYLMWRLHRNQLLIAGGLLIVVTAVLLLLKKSQSQTIEVIDFATMGMPLLLGLFWGSPLLAQEFEDGTNGLVWTQCVTRRRWLRSNLLWMILAAAAWGAAVTAVVTWWSLPEVSLGLSRLTEGQFDIQGIAPVAYSVFAVVLGIAVGSTIRRVPPAMAMTLAAFIAVRVVVVLARPHFMSPVSKVFSNPNLLGISALRGSWWLSSPAPVGRNGTLLTYQPADRFWAFQGIETGIYIVLAAGLVALAYRMVVTRDA
ncbi:MAG: hypothetical protein ACRDVP_06615 [Acidimicrobiales bacterium]